MQGESTFNIDLIHLRTNFISSNLLCTSMYDILNGIIGTNQIHIQRGIIL